MKRMSQEKDPDYSEPVELETVRRSLTSLLRGRPDYASISIRRQERKGHLLIIENPLKVLNPRRRGIKKMRTSDYGSNRGLCRAVTEYIETEHRHEKFDILFEKNTLEPAEYVAYIFDS